MRLIFSVLVHRISAESYFYLNVRNNRRAVGALIEEFGFIAAMECSGYSLVLLEPILERSIDPRLPTVTRCPKALNNL